MHQRWTNSKPEQHLAETKVKQSTVEFIHDLNIYSAEMLMLHRPGNKQSRDGGKKLQQNSTES